jgi:dsDNA-binding SOS-regulon protein
MDNVMDDPEIRDYYHRSIQSQMNDFFDGEQAILSEQFYRWITKKPLLTKEEVQERVEKYIAKEKEIWDING